jgi:hypothetical protein
MWQAIAEATREKDGMRVAALKEAKEKAAKSWGAMGQRIMDRASKFAHGNLEGRKQLELPIRQPRGAQPRGAKPRGAQLVQLSQVSDTWRLVEAAHVLCAGARGGWTRVAREHNTSERVLGVAREDNTSERV